MEQFRQIGKVLGSLKALMVFQNDIQINQRQCCFLLDSLSMAYETIAEEMRSNLRFAEKHTTWKGLEQPLKELYRVCKEGEAYIRQCFEIKDWWAKAIVLYQNRDCIEFHIHNLLCCLPIVIEAIEVAGELSNLDEDQMRKRRLFWSRKYQNEWKDPKLFQWSFGKKYLVSPEFCNRMDTVWKEDRWILLDKIHEKETSGSTKYQHRLVNLLSKNLDDSEPSNAKLLPSTILVGSKDYQVRRRLGNGGQYKEILWLGESFVLRHIKGDAEPLMHEICQLFSLAHPNILQLLCGFTDEEKKEYFLVTELMSKNIGSYMKELNSPKKRIPFSHTVAVDIMLQVARGMEYLHSKKIYHGNLNPSKILVRARINNTEGSLLAKVSGYGLSSLTHLSQKTSHSNEAPSYIWHAPEVLAAQEESGSTIGAKYTGKSDVYSFGMICFEILTGKVPFDDAHLQGDKMSRNIRAGERPLFPFHCPKYVVTLTKKCWHSDPNQRPSFSSICRILRYIKRFLVMNPDQSQADPPIPLIDYYDVETGLLNKFPSWRKDDPFPVSEIPFQMFAYRVMEKEKSMVNFKDTSESGSEGASMSGDENVATVDDSFLSVTERNNLLFPESANKRLSSIKRSADIKTNKYPGTPKGRSTRPPQLTRCSRSLNMNIADQMLLMSPRIKRHSGHSSDSELS
ncbi:hypothetical protein Nepgr_024398 [Nepenthes gracilis]|uniref:Protein kinase domain-containing protein n=1 Tax=Nepenthes gracilis TaxID=150966 RepID=A0AAD3T467_NEPGR|nr:hypothetical protein Nepgr_024398 [Nepenthes gracilis]